MRSNTTSLMCICDILGRRIQADQRTRMMEELISRGADLNAVDRTGKNVLMIAITRAHYDVFEMLLRKQKISLDVISINESQTALMFAAQLGMPERFLRMLLDEGAFPNIVSPGQRKTAAEIARSAGNNRQADLIESYMTTDGQTEGKPAVLPTTHESKVSIAFRQSLANPPAVQDTTLAEKVKTLMEEVNELKKWRERDAAELQDLRQKIDKLVLAAKSCEEKES
jgi:hypothetical protein